MKIRSLVLACLFVSLSLKAQAETLKILISKDVEIPKVNAEVVILNGSVTASNCDILTEENQDGVTYSLKQEGMTFSCVPSPSTKKVSRTESIDAGGEITMAEVIATMAEIGKAYEDKEGRSNGYFSSLQSATPSCQINNDGTVDFSSCVCESELQAFDQGANTCAADPTVLSFYANSCSDQSSYTKAVLKHFGDTVFPPPSVSFGMCSVELNHYRAIPHDLVFKVLFFAYQTRGLKLAVQAEVNESISLIVTQEEVQDLVAWAQDWAQSGEAQSYPEQIRRQAENLDYAFEYGLEGVIKIVE